MVPEIINAVLFGKDSPLALSEVQVIFEPKSDVVFGSDRVEVPAHEEEDIPRSIGRIHVNFSYLERVKYPHPATLIHEWSHVNRQYVLGYTIAASFLFWQEWKDPGLIVELNRALRDCRYHRLSSNNVVRIA